METYHGTNRIRVYIGYTVAKLLDVNQIVVSYRKNGMLEYNEFFPLDQTGIADATKLFEDLCLQVEISITQNKLKLK